MRRFPFLAAAAFAVIHVLSAAPLVAQVDLLTVRSNSAQASEMIYRPGFDFDSRPVQGDGSFRVLFPSASVQVRSRGTTGQQTSVAVDGGLPNHTALALDGVPVIFPQNSVTDPGILPLDFISRTDVYKNNMVPYGIPGTSGLINFRTTPAGLDENRLQLYAGSYWNWGGKIETSRSAGPVDFLLGASFVSASNNFPFVDSWNTTNTARNSDYMRYSMIGKLEWDGLRISATRTERDGGAGIVSVARQKDILTTAGVRYGSDAGNGLRELQVSYSGWDNTYRDPSYGTDDRHYNGTILASVTAGWTWAAYSLRPKVQNTVFLADSSRIGQRLDNETGLTLENALDLEWAEFNLGVQQYYRIERGYALVPGGGATLKPLDFLRLIGALSRHFRYPTWNDLHWPEDSFARGNPALSPEDGWAWKSGVLFLFYPLRASLTYSESRLTGLIQWLPGPDGKWAPVNSGRTLTRTFNASADLDWREGPWGMTAGLSFSVNQDLNDDPDSFHYGKRLIYSPLYKTGVSLALDYDRFAGLGVNVRQASERYTTEANTVWLPPYWVLDMRMSIAFVFLAVENALDQNYQEMQGYPLPGRVFRGGIDWKF